MFKLMGKEINAFLDAQTILIWTYEFVSRSGPAKSCSWSAFKLFDTHYVPWRILTEIIWNWDSTHKKHEKSPSMHLLFNGALYLEWKRWSSFYLAPFIFSFECWVQLFKLFYSILSGILLQCQTVMIQMRPHNFSGPNFWVQNVCKGCQ